MIWIARSEKDTDNAALEERLSRLVPVRKNLAVYGLEGDIRHGRQVNSYFVLANPPFDVNAVDEERLKDSAGPGRRFPFGLPRTDKANGHKPMDMSIFLALRLRLCPQRFGQ